MGVVNEEKVSLWARKRRRLKRLPSGQYLTYSLSSSLKSSSACPGIMLKILTRICARRQPYFTPLARGKVSKMSQLYLIWPHWFSRSLIAILLKLWEQLSHFTISHIPVLLTETKAFVRSTKVAYSPWSCH